MFNRIVRAAQSRRFTHPSLIVRICWLARVSNQASAMCAACRAGNWPWSLRTPGACTSGEHAYVHFVKGLRRYFMMYLFTQAVRARLHAKFA
jgi:hypothetical protein